MSMHTYSLRPEGYQDLFRKSLIRSVITSAVILSVVAFLFTGNESGNQQSDEVRYYLFIFMGFAMFYSSYRAIKKQKAAWQTFRLQIDDNSILRQHAGLSDLSISRQDITDIVEMPNQDLLIKTAKSDVYIAVPRWIEQPEEVRSKLSAFRELQTQSRLTFWQQYPWVVSVGTMALFGAHFFSQTSWVILASGLPLLILLCWSCYSIWKSQQVTKQTKWMMLLMPFLMLGIIFRILNALGIIG